MKVWQTLLLTVCVLGLAACENSAASFEIDPNSQHSISLLREQRFFWSDVVEQKVVLARAPECQRRFPLPDGQKNMTPVEIYRVQPRLFVLHQGSDWYALGTDDCQMQKFDQPPASYGQRVGRFVHKDGKLSFAAN